MSTSNTTTKFAGVVGLLDPDAPAKVVTHIHPTTAPDLFEDGMVFWIGVDATVACDVLAWLDLDTLTEEEPAAKTDFVSLIERGGWYARIGQMPEECGVAVFPFGEVTGEGAPLKTHKIEYTVWRMAQDTLLVG